MNFRNVRLPIENRFFRIQAAGEINAGDFLQLLAQNCRVFFGVDGMIIGDEHIMPAAGGQSFPAELNRRFDGAEIIAEMRRSGRFDAG